MRFSRELSSMATFCALQPALAMERTPEAVRTEPMEALVVTVSGMRGNSIIRQAGHEYTYGPGELVFVNNCVPYTLLSSAVADPSGLLIPMSRLGRHRQTVERMQRPIAANTPLSRAAAAFVRRFAAETSVLSTSTTPPSSAEQAAVDLVLAALAELDGSPVAMEDNTLFIRELAADLIERHHRNASFSPDSIAEHMHLSRRQLYRYFESSEKSLAGRIADRRLDTAVETLVGHPAMSVSAVAAASGFPTVATFRNRFKARFGIGPVEYRQRLGR
ncbi:helix-turn-helix domain-containing protein [Gordonia shandongensis]|uniref:helix-turn-helix domain-containing protein n=1 Tax=Gordonia shandongensis TaxID=376351 RepID=UPI000409A4B5|nr:helix-turn-helix domain-containing protein [Gordonia shandongensis]